MKKLLLLLPLLLPFPLLYAQQMDSIYDQNTWRTFIVHLPAGYSAANTYPLVMNLHGYNSNAAQQQSYTQFDHVADTLGFIVVYPNGINNSWAVGGNTDVDFISHLTDTLRSRYSCNNCLFITGMSDGAFMTYKLACALPKPITAIAPVSGNMAVSLQNTCALSTGLPVLHIHGTADPLVYYTGVPPVIPPVDTTIHWWVQHNACNPTAQFMAIPDINTADSCTAERYTYTGSSQVVFYKIINGGHTWPGAALLPPLGFTNQDINASQLIGSFFSGYCTPNASVQEWENEDRLNVYPNPVHGIFTISFPSDDFTVQLVDLTGRVVLTRTHGSQNTQLDCSELRGGVYMLRVLSGSAITTKRILIQ